MKYSEDLLFTLQQEVRKDLQKNLIFEDVYIYDIFEKLINFIRSKLVVGNEEYLKFDFEEISKFFPQNWNALKYFKKQKILYVFVQKQFKNDTDLKLTNEEIQRINQKILNVGGTFISDFQYQKNVGIIIINSLTDYSKFFKLLIHQLIHYFQWQTGKSIHNFLKNKQIGISENDKEQISIILKTSKQKVDKILNSILSPKQLQAYVNNVYYEFKDYCQKHRIKFSKIIISLICESFQNKDQKDFKSYYENVRKQLQKNYLDYDTLLSQIGFPITFLILFGYVKFGYNSFKNHLYGYFQKEKELN